MPDDVWDEAARHYSEPQLAALTVAIATINAFNRFNVATKQVTGEFTAQIAKSGVGQPEARPSAASAAPGRISRTRLAQADGGH